MVESGKSAPSRWAVRLDFWAVVLLVLGALGLGGWNWLRAHPQHNPWAPLSLGDPPGWATARKLVRLRDDPAECRAVLKRSNLHFSSQPAAGEGVCRRADRTILADDAARGLALRPAPATATCAINAGLALWLAQSVQPAARRLLNAKVARIEHLGTGNCRRIGGGDTGSWSEHATGNAIDVAAFVLSDGRRVSVRTGWSAGKQGEFLHAVRDDACGTFGTVLSPDYNQAHADHLHFDQAGRRRGWSFCR